VDEISTRELRDAGSEVLARVGRGESLTVIRDGEPVAELHPVPRPGLTREALLTRWRAVPAVEPAAFRADVDHLLDGSL
jgi:antitoxin (DNA-binding transcriptional repressor) of toxin-antitoxin stability system